MKADNDNVNNGCPKCGAFLDAKAVICLECGFDTRTGTCHVLKIEKPVKAKRSKSKPIVIAVLCAVILLTVGAPALQMLTRRGLFEPGDEIDALIVVGLLVGFFALIPAVIGEIAFIGVAFTQSVLWGCLCISPQLALLAIRLYVQDKATEEVEILLIISLLCPLAYWAVRLGFIMSHWAKMKRLLIVWALPVFLANIGLLALYGAAVRGGWVDKVLIFR